MMPSQQGYDRAITVFSPDGRLYQVEYAIETVRRGSIALGIKTKNGVILAAEEKTKKLQISKSAQKIFQIDNHIGVVAAGYIPDARSQADNARFFSQSNRLVYDEPVEVETVAKHLADQCQQYTQYAGVRPYGVALILGGVVNNTPQLYLTDPSGTYIPYNAISIGSNSDLIQDFLEKAGEVLKGSPEANGIILRGFSSKPKIPQMKKIYKHSFQNLTFLYLANFSPKSFPKKFLTSSITFGILVIPPTNITS